MASDHRYERDCPRSVPDCWWHRPWGHRKPYRPCPCTRPSSIPHRRRRSTRDRAEDECCCPAGSDRLQDLPEPPTHRQSDHRWERCRGGNRSSVLGDPDPTPEADRSGCPPYRSEPEGQPRSSIGPTRHVPQRPQSRNPVDRRCHRAAAQWQPFQPRSASDAHGWVECPPVLSTEQ